MTCATHDVRQPRGKNALAASGETSDTCALRPVTRPGQRHRLLASCPCREDRIVRNQAATVTGLTGVSGNRPVACGLRIYTRICSAPGALTGMSLALSHHAHWHVTAESNSAPASGRGAGGQPPQAAGHGHCCRSDLKVPLGWGVRPVAGSYLPAAVPANSEARCAGSHGGKREPTSAPAGAGESARGTGPGGTARLPGPAMGSRNRHSRGAWALVTHRSERAAAARGGRGASAHRCARCV